MESAISSGNVWDSWVESSCGELSREREWRGRVVGSWYVRSGLCVAKRGGLWESWLRGCDGGGHN